MKTKYIHAHMQAAEVYAKLSSAKRLQVGCVVVKNDTIIGIGYNGMPSGWDNNCEEEYLYEDGGSQLRTRSEVLHAESNSLAKIARSTNSSENATMFVTHAPCLDCAKLIHQAGINSVYYRNSYRDDKGIDFLKKCGVQIENISE
jgi:dCMP deaminase